MDFEGVVYKVLAPVSGTSARGEWKKQEIVFELPSEMNRKICVTFFGDRAGDVASFKEGDTASVSVNVESREYNGRWYTDVRGWRVVKKQPQAAAQTPPPFDLPPLDEQQAPAQTSPTESAQSQDFDDLPF